MCTQAHCDAYRLVRLTGSTLLLLLLFVAGAAVQVAERMSFEIDVNDRSALLQVRRAQQGCACDHPSAKVTCGLGDTAEQEMQHSIA